MTRWRLPLYLVYLAALLASGCKGGDDTGDTEDTDDTTPPNPPVLTEVIPHGPANDNAPVIHGTAEDDALIRVFSDDACTAEIASGYADGDGDFAVILAVGDDTTTTIYANAADVAGNVSDCAANGITYVEDSTAPAPPSLTSTDPVSPADQHHPLVNGTAESHASVDLFSDAACTTSLASTTADGTGAFSTSVGVDQNATTELSATATDAAGNTSTCSDPLPYVEDSTTPDPPVLTGTDPASPSTDDTPDLAGTTEAGAEIHVYTDSSCTSLLAADFADGSGGFTIALTVPENEVTTLYATATDGAGHTSDCSTGLAYEHDALAPDPPELTHTTPPSPSPENQPYIHGTTEADAQVRLFTDDECSNQITSASADGSGVFTIRITASPGTNTVYADATDATGNTSDCSDGLVYEDSGDFTELTIVSIAPLGDPKRVVVEGDLEFDLTARSPQGSIETSWIVVDGEGSFNDPDIEDPTFTASFTPGLVWLRVTADDTVDTVSRDIYVLVEPDADNWFTVADNLSEGEADLIHLRLGPDGLPWIMNIDGDLGESSNDGFDLRDMAGICLGSCPVAETYYMAFSQSATFAVAPDGTHWIAWAGGYDDEWLRTAFWDGSGWTAAGDLSSYGTVRSVDLVFEGETPWIAFQSAERVIVASWYEDHWTQLGDGIVDEDTSDEPAEIRLAVQDGIPVVAFRHWQSILESPGSVFRWDAGDGAWDELGDLDSSMAYMGDVVIASDGTVVVSHLEYGGGVHFSPKVVRYNELTDQWVPIGMWDGDWFLWTDQVRMTIDREDNLYIVVQQNVWMTTDWSSWHAIGSAPFGQVTFANEIADVEVREVGGERIVYVAFPDDTDSGGDTSLAAFVLR